MIAKLDPEFMPMAKVINDFKAEVNKAEKEKLVISIERNGGLTSVYGMDIFKENTGHDEENYDVAERIIKTLLWAKGGYKVYVAGSKYIYERLSDEYRVGGKREFDFNFMARVYEKPFEVIYVENVEDAPAENDTSSPVGRHLDGCRIGFDAGGSDRKVSAVIDGETVYSEEVVWFPKLESDPKYHYDGILNAMKKRASYRRFVTRESSSAATTISVTARALLSKTSDILPITRY